MERFDPPPDALDAKLKEVSDDLESAKGAGKKIIDLVVDRNQKLAHVHAQSETLTDVGQQFRSGASALHRQTFWNNAKTKMALIAACVTLLVIMLLIVRRS